MGAPTPKRWFVVDCVGLLCMSIALAVVGFEWYVINVDVLWPDLQRSPWLSALHMLVFNLLIGMLLASYARAVTTNPGTLSRLDPLIARTSRLTRGQAPSSGRHQPTR